MASRFLFSLVLFPWKKNYDNKTVVKNRITKKNSYKLRFSHFSVSQVGNDVFISSLMVHLENPCLQFFQSFIYHQEYSYNAKNSGNPRIIYKKSCVHPIWPCPSGTMPVSQLCLVQFLPWPSPGATGAFAHRVFLAPRLLTCNSPPAPVGSHNAESLLLTNWQCAVSQSPAPPHPKVLCKKFLLTLGLPMGIVRVGTEKDVTAQVKSNNLHKHNFRHLSGTLIFWLILQNE